MSLLELQRAVRDGVLGAPSAGLLERIAGAGLRPEQRLQIHRNNTLLSLTEALKTSFPVVARLVGEKFFGFAADRFIRAQPPRAPCLSDYGAAFPRFLAGFEPAANLPYLPDVARLEWAIDKTYAAEDEPPLEAAALAALPAQRYPALRFALRASCRLVASRYPVKRIWLANQPGAASETLQLDSGRERLLVMRRDFEVMLIELDPAEFAFLAALDGGKSAEAAYVAACAEDPGFDLASVLARQLQRCSLAQLSAGAAEGDATNPGR